MDTINHLTFEEENAQEDPSFNVDENVEVESDYTSSEEESMEENSAAESEDGETEEMTKGMDQLDIEQIPVGVDKVTMTRNNKTLEGEVLVFATPESDDVTEQNINELDSQELDGDSDLEFNPDALKNTPEEQEQDAADEEYDSEGDDVDGDDLNGITVATDVNGDEKLVFSDVTEFRENNKPEEQSAEGESVEEIGTEGMVSTKEYDEEEDPDFNPVYCDQTLSDVDTEEEGEDDVPPAVRLTGDMCILRCDKPMAIPPQEESFEEEVSGAMECN